MAENFDLEALKREYVASDERGDAKFTIDFHDMTIVLERLEQAEQAVTRVRAIAQDWEANGNSCAVGDRSADVWHATANAIRRAMDGDERG